MATYRKYEIKLIHRVHDWDCYLYFLAPSARTARRWAEKKLAAPDEWLAVSARAVKGL